MSLNKTQLVAAIANDTGMTKINAEKALKSTLGAITNELAGGGSISLIGFGTFSVANRAARTGKNPRTGESLKIPAKKVAKFKAGKALATSVSGPTDKGKKKAKKK